MSSTASSRKILTRKAVLYGAFPIMLANAAAPIVGFVDTWVIGNYVGREALAGIGLGAVIFGIFYWGFGFLRMSTGGLSAQADGAGDQRSVQAHLFRAVPMGFAIGLVIFALQGFLIDGIMQFFPAEAAVDSGARDYLHARLWGLPCHFIFHRPHGLVHWFSPPCPRALYANRAKSDQCAFVAPVRSQVRLGAYTGSG